MDSIKVNLDERSYPIYFGSGILKDFGKTFKKFFDNRKAVIVTNPTVGKLYYKAVEDSLKREGFEPHRIEIPDGEEYKTLTWASRLFDKLIALKADRQTPLIALGGGVIGDLTGFVAATYLRGVPFIQVPTTLLSQVDSSIGGKTAVNHPRGKNLIGAFYQPKAVFIDIDTLKTLPKEEILCGVAEIIKYGIIRDSNFFEYLEDNIEKLINLNEDVLIHSIKRSCEIKADAVSKDEREAGLRAILNFGHTIGHAIESLTDYKKYRHGEAVAIGMVYAARLSLESGLCSNKDYERVVNLIKSAGLPIAITGLDADAIIDSLYLDKKVKEEKIRFILMNGIGSVEIKSDITNELTKKVLSH